MPVVKGSAEYWRIHNSKCALCEEAIGDWQDDLGEFWKQTPLGYLPVCKDCCGPLTGDR